MNLDRDEVYLIGRMNFDDNEEPRRAINYEADDQKLAPREDLAINANDVLCGRGKTSFNHVGNRRFRHIISESIDDYNSAGSRKAKSAVVKRVHDSIRATGGRFLKLDDAQRMWVELSQQRSLEKVSHAIRDATTTNENMKKKKQKVHSTIAQVAAHVTSRFPGVQLEGKLDDGEDDDDPDSPGRERLAFTSIDSGGLGMTMPMLSGRSQNPLAEASDPDLGLPVGASSSSELASELTSSRIPSRIPSVLREPPEERPMPPLLRPSAASSQIYRHHGSEEDLSLPIHQPSSHEVLHHPIAASQAPSHEVLEHPSSLPHASLNRGGGDESGEDIHHHHEQQRQEPVHHEDDFVSYINEVLGPVSPADLDIDPLRKLAKRKRRDDS